MTNALTSQMMCAPGKQTDTHANIRKVCGSTRATVMCAQNRLVYARTISSAIIILLAATAHTGKLLVGFTVNGATYTHLVYTRRTNRQENSLPATVLLLLLLQASFWASR